MATKLSALTATTSAGDDDILYVGDTADGGTSYTSKKITRANLFSGIATESYVNTQVSNLIDGAPDALNTLNELAAALNDDASAASSLTALINANETHIDNVATLSGLAKDSTSLGTFTGTTIADSTTIKAALQTLETAVESKGNATSLTSLTTAVGDLNTLSGVAQNATNLGTFTGSTISDNVAVKTAIQALETAVETKAATGANVNTLVGVTSGETEPASFLFLVVDASDGSIKALDKNFVEVE
jgi:hypothetical protein